MPKVKIRIVNHSPNPLPGYATEGSAGMDIMANLSRSISIAPLQRMLVPTGLFMELPQGYEGQVRPRSGLAIRNGITCLNSPGTIDSDYRGEVKVILVNLSDREHTIQHGDRIAQLVVQKVQMVAWQPVDDVSTTKRDKGGFGHTGK